MLGKARHLLPNSEALERNRAQCQVQCILEMCNPGSDETANPKNSISYRDKKYLGKSKAKLLRKSSIAYDLADTSTCKRKGVGGSGLTRTWLASLSNSSPFLVRPGG